MKLAATKFLYSYWDELRGERATPERADIDPSRIRTMLTDVFMLEVDQDKSYPIRLSGTRVGALFLRELKGETFIDLWDVNDRDDLLAILDSVVDDPTPAILGVHAIVPGRAPLELELLLLPLRHLGRTHSRVMGALIPVERPSWYGLLPASNLTIASLKIVRASTVTLMERAQIGHDQNQHLTFAPLRRKHLSIYSGGLEQTRPLSE